MIFNSNRIHFECLREREKKRISEMKTSKRDDILITNKNLKMNQERIFHKLKKNRKKKEYTKRRPLEYLKKDYY